MGLQNEYCDRQLIAQLVKNLPAVQKTQVHFLGWEGPLEKEKATHSSILATGHQNHVVILPADGGGGMAAISFTENYSVCVCICVSSILAP